MTASIIASLELHSHRSDVTVTSHLPPPRVGLCMIVKNESAIIERCLDSLRGFLDYVLVEDTGSTDGTQELIRGWLARNSVPGEVVEEPWRDFAYNRTHSLAQLRQRHEIDFAFVMDADDLFQADPGTDFAALKNGLLADFYDVEIIHGGIRHHRIHLFRNALPFVYRGVLHEFVEVPPAATIRRTLEGVRILASTSGARSHNPNKYRDDAEVLERALAVETDPFMVSRYTFYLAQSYRDCGENEKALAAYLRRAELGYWVEEQYVSLRRAADIMAALNRPAEQVLATYAAATERVPTRAEALYAATRYCRDHGRNAEGAELGRRAAALAKPAGGLFIEDWVYEYGALDEFALNAYWTGRYKESLDANLLLLAERKIPADMRDRIVANARFAAAGLPGEPELGTLGRENFLDQHVLKPARSLHTRLDEFPSVLVAILAKQKQNCLPMFLQCIEALAYPKDRITLYVRTNNNTDDTEGILRQWIERIGDRYAAVEFDATNVDRQVQRFGVHEWNPERFSVLGRIRQISMQRAVELGADYYFVADVDNFVRPETLRELVATRLPIVSPFLRVAAKGSYYSNYHAEIDANGYFQSCDQYNWILLRHVRGLIEVPVVHCTYLVRTDVIPALTYEDGSGRYEYVIFSDSARKASIPQYLDNRQIYGYISFQEGDKHFEGDLQLIADRLKTGGGGD
jgi:glycosyltransferase involved in cell wall biosynthesis